MAGLTYGSPDYKSTPYKFGNAIPVIACEGDSKWARIVLGNDELNTTFLGTADKTIGVLKGIPSSLIPLHIESEFTDMDTNGTPTLELDYRLILNDGSDTVRLVVNNIYAGGTDGDAIDTSHGVGTRGVLNFESGFDTIDELREAIGGNSYDLVLSPGVASATAAAGTGEISVLFLRDGRDLSDVTNADIADGQA